MIELEKVVAVADSLECPNQLLMGGCGFYLEVAREARTNRTYTLCAVSPEQRKEVCKLFLGKRGGTLSPRKSPLSSPRKSPRVAEKSPTHVEAAPVVEETFEFVIFIGAPRVFCESMSTSLNRDLKSLCSLEFRGGHEVCELKLTSASKEHLRQGKRVAHRWVDTILAQFHTDLKQRAAAPSMDEASQSLFVRESDAAKRVTTSNLTTDLQEMLKQLELDEDF